MLAQQQQGLPMNGCRASGASENDLRILPVTGLICQIVPSSSPCAKSRPSGEKAIPEISWSFG
jgi:hypothetical protein